MRKMALLTLVTAFGLGTGAIALAEERAPGKSGETPGHEMQEHGSKAGSPGASGYAPGHNKDADDLRGGRATTGSGVRDRDDRMRGDRDDLKKGRDRDDLRKGDGDHDRDDRRLRRDRD